jgi:hypothetical protein
MLSQCLCAEGEGLLIIPQAPVVSAGVGEAIACPT